MDIDSFNSKELKLLQKKININETALKNDIKTVEDISKKFYSKKKLIAPVTQYFLDNDCGNGEVVFKTTSGTRKKVKLELVEEDRACLVQLNSPGKYKVKIGFKYSMVDDYGKVVREIDKWHIIEKVLSYKEHILIGTGWNADIGEDGFADAFNNKCMRGGAYPLKIDILELCKV